MCGIGFYLAKAGASEETIIDALENRDIALGFSKYADRRDDTEYRRIAAKALQEVAEESKTQTRIPNEGRGRVPVVVSISDVQREEVKWLWHNRLALGKLHIVEGDPEVGKSWLLLALAAGITMGAALPGQGPQPPGKVLLLSAEDGLADTIRPRLEDMGADLGLVTALTAVRDEEGRERLPSLVDDLQALELVLAKGGYRLVVIDPINAYLGASLDTHRDAAIRSVLSPLAALAERCGVAVAAVRHLTKTSRDRAIYRGQGNIGYMAAARVGHLVGLNPDNPTERVLVCIKNNLALKPPALAFEIRDGRFLWKGESPIKAEMLLGPDSTSEQRSALDEAIGFLLSVLAGGRQDVGHVKGQAKKADITEATLRRAREYLGVRSWPRYERGKRGVVGWDWELPDLDAQPPRGNYEHLNVERGQIGDLGAHSIPLEDEHLKDVEVF